VCEALNSTEGYTGEVCTRTAEGTWSCPPGRVRYAGGNLAIKQSTGEKMYAKSVVHAQYLWSGAAMWFFDGIKEISTQNLDAYQYLKFPYSSNGFISFEDSCTQYLSGADRYAGQGIPVNVEYVPGRGFIYAYAQTHEEFGEDLTYQYDEVNQIRVIQSLSIVSSKKWDVYESTECGGSVEYTGSIILRPKYWTEHTIQWASWWYPVNQSHYNNWIGPIDRHENYDPAGTDTVECDLPGGEKSSKTTSIVFAGQKPYRCLFYKVIYISRAYTYNGSAHAYGGRFTLLDINGESVKLKEDIYHDLGPVPFKHPYNSLEDLQEFVDDPESTPPFFVYNNEPIGYFPITSQNGMGVLYSVFAIKAPNHHGHSNKTLYITLSERRFNWFRWIDMRVGTHLLLNLYFQTSHSPVTDYQYPPLRQAAYGVSTHFHINGSTSVLFDQYVSDSGMSNWAETWRVDYKYYSDWDNCYDVVAAFLSPTEYVISYAEPIVDRASYYMEVSVNELRDDLSTDGTWNVHTLSSGLTDVRFNYAADKIVSASVGLGVLKRYEEDES
jgi:hypothetical protein